MATTKCPKIMSIHVHYGEISRDRSRNFIRPLRRCGGQITTKQTCCSWSL